MYPTREYTTPCDQHTLGCFLEKLCRVSYGHPNAIISVLDLKPSTLLTDFLMQVTNAVQGLHVQEVDAGYNENNNPREMI